MQTRGARSNGRRSSHRSRHTTSHCHSSATEAPCRSASFDAKQLGTWSPEQRGKITSQKKLSRGYQGKNADCLSELPVVSVKSHSPFNYARGVYSPDGSTYRAFSRTAKMAILGKLLTSQEEVGSIRRAAKGNFNFILSVVKSYTQLDTVLYNCSIEIYEL